jgi:hypothetical protein
VVTWVVWSATVGGMITRRGCWPESDPVEVAAIVADEYRLAGIPHVEVSAEVCPARGVE